MNSAGEPVESVPPPSFKYVECNKEAYNNNVERKYILIIYIRNCINASASKYSVPNVRRKFGTDRNRLICWCWCCLIKGKIYYISYSCLCMRILISLGPTIRRVWRVGCVQWAGRKRFSETIYRANQRAANQRVLWNVHICVLFERLMLQSRVRIISTTTWCHIWRVFQFAIGWMLCTAWCHCDHWPIRNCCR